MRKSYIAGIGHYLPEKVVTNDDLARHMDTSDEWIQERTGIRERRYAERHKETPVTLAANAAEVAMERAGTDKEEIDFIIFATLSPDYFFPGCGVLLQRELEIANTEIGALDVRNQCSCFIYALSVADQFIKTGMYKNVLVIGSENHSGGLDFTSRGRGVSVIFGDGAGAAVLTRSDHNGQGILSTHLHSEGKHALELSLKGPSTLHWVPEIIAENPQGDDIPYYPYMNGQFVFKNAVVRFSEVIKEGLDANGLEVKDIDMLIPHQANLRISQFIQHKFKLNDDQVHNNIQKYGNTTAASIPIALTEAWENGRINEGDTVVLAAFGSGFTWASAIMKW